MANLKKLLLNSLFVFLISSAAWAGQMSGGDYVITKDLLGAAGPKTNAADASTDYALSFAWGEPASGNRDTNANDAIISGYFGGGFGDGQTFTLISSAVNAGTSKIFLQNNIPVGVPYDASITLTFSDQVNVNSLAAGIQTVMAFDHLGQSASATVSVTIDPPDPVAHTVTLHPSTPWLGNTLYDIQLTPQLLSVDGFQLDQLYHVYFVTLLDHRQENVVLNPLIPQGASADNSIVSVSPMSIDIPTESLSDYSAVVLSRDPLMSPLRVDPKIVQAANDKARSAGGPYRVPLSIQEINAYDTQGNLMGPLSKPAQVSISYTEGSSLGSAVSNLIRPQTLSFWVLDEEHSLWVKLPASENAMGLHTVTASAARFSVFALMGSSDGSAGDSYAFPVPWRPHGPNAGTGSGQTGTEADGINFSNLPSECTIKIYTIAGDVVREIRHSDTGGSIAQEKWDVKTTHGEPVASGVYLWRVESSVDGKNGKLMVIR